jgi:hypothetical protein
MPDERADIERRLSAAEQVVPRVTAYGAEHPETWAGLEIDQARGGVIVVRVSAEVERHRSALLDLVGNDAIVEVRKVDWSEAALRGFEERLNTAWLDEVPAAPTLVGVDLGLNRLVLEVSSPHPDAIAIIGARYGNPPWLVVRSDGTGSHLLRPGTVVVRVRDPEGRPVPGLQCSFKADTGGLRAEGWETDNRGVCRAELPSTGYWVRAADDATGDILGIGRVVIPEGEEVGVEIVARAN